MIRKDLISTKKGLNKPKAETIIVKGTVTREQQEVLQKFIGVIGSNEQDVVGKILTLWLYNEGYIKVKKINLRKK